MTTPNIDVQRVDYSNSRHSSDLRRLLHEYAQFDSDGGMPIALDSFDRLPQMLEEFPTAFSVLAYIDDQAVGLANCFFGFSTFACQRLVNVHDVVVSEDARGQGVAGRMLGEVETIAKQNHCCRITLEVLADNTPARRAYEKCGFTRTPSHPDVDTLFLQKAL